MTDMLLRVLELETLLCGRLRSIVIKFQLVRRMNMYYCNINIFTKFHHNCGLPQSKFNFTSFIRRHVMFMYISLYDY